KIMTRHWSGAPPAQESLLRDNLLEAGEELLPTEPGALISLLLVRSEAGLLHAQESAGALRRERPGHHALEAHRVPGVGQRSVRLDDQHPAVDRAPVAAQLEAMVDGRLEV